MILEAARSYVARGWSVIPVGVPTAAQMAAPDHVDNQAWKKPKLKSWKEYQSRVATDAELVEWFEAGKSNIAIVTGAVSGLSIVDIDGSDAVELAQNLGIPEGAPTVKTGKGYHVYCQYQEGHRNFQKRDDLPGIDFRGEGGYVLAPPSLHARGTCYEWVVEPGTVFPDVPEWVLKPAYKKADTGSKANTGNRNMKLTSEIGRYLRSNTDATLQNTIEHAQNWNSENCIPPLGSDEVRRTAESIYDTDRRNRKTESKPVRTFNFSDWCCTRYTGSAPATQWLVKNIFQIGVALMVAAMGDTGKSFSLLRLAYLIATGNIYNSGQQIAFGGTVEVYGTAVVFTAEDCMNTIHSRVKAIDELDLLKDHPGKLIVIPLPDAGGPLTLVQKSRDSITTMPVYDQIKAQLLKIPDLRMVVFDPLQNFTTLDLNAPENSQYVCGVMAELATVTGAAVFVSHHMKKTEKQIRTIAEAREAIRGTTALVDGLRGAYALWPETDDDTRKICTDLGREYRYGSIVRGAIVKANGNADRRIKTFHRDHNGILQDVTEQVSGIRQHNLDVSVLVLVIAEAAERGHPFTTGGAAGITLERRGELPEPFSTLSRDILRGMVDDLIKDGRLVKAAHGNEKKPTWLDVPDGNFALGCGEFATGSSAQIEFEEVKE